MKTLTEQQAIDAIQNILEYRKKHDSQDFGFLAWVYSYDLINYFNNNFTSIYIRTIYKKLADKGLIRVKASRSYGPLGYSLLSFENYTAKDDSFVKNITYKGELLTPDYTSSLSAEGYVNPICPTMDNTPITPITHTTANSLIARLKKCMELTVELQNEFMNIRSEFKHINDTAEHITDIHNIQNRLFSIANRSNIILK